MEAYRVFPGQRELGCPLCETGWPNESILARHLVDNHAADRRRARKIVVAVKYHIPFDTGDDSILI